MEIRQSPAHLSPLARHGPISRNTVDWLEPASLGRERSLAGRGNANGKSIRLVVHHAKQKNVQEAKAARRNSLPTLLGEIVSSGAFACVWISATRKPGLSDRINSTSGRSVLDENLKKLAKHKTEKEKAGK